MVVTRSVNALGLGVPVFVFRWGYAYFSTKIEFGGIVLLYLYTHPSIHPCLPACK